MTVETSGTGSRREGVLRRRLLVAFLGLSLVPLFGSNAIGFIRSRTIVERLVERYLDGVASLQAAHIEGRLQQRSLYLDAIANGNRFLQAAVERGLPGTTSAMSQAADEEAVRAYLLRKIEESGRFGALALFTPEGHLVASSHADHMVNAWPSAAEVGITLLRPDDPQGLPTLRFTAPVRDMGGGVTGYLAATIPLEQGGDFLEIPEHVAGSIESFILDEQGHPVFVSHPHGHFAYDRPMASPLVGLPPGAHARYRDREGVDVIGASASLPAYSWLFVTEVPAADALGELSALRNLSMALGSIFALLVLAAAWLIAGNIVAPVRRLVLAARGLGAGDLAVRVPSPGSDEIGELSEAFNEMADEMASGQARIARLHQREIERAQQLATVGELASGVAHEIKNPVAGISHGLDLVLRRVDDPALEPITSEMKRQLHRIEGAVRDLLSFARPPEPTFAPTSVNTVLERALTLVSPAAHKRGIRIVTKLAEAVPEVGADAELLRQAVVNLLINALQFSGDGSVVEAETRSLGSEVMVAVTDQGPGLDPAAMEQIFKPFYTTRHSGTGLGLPITRGIVERHGGRVEVQSAPGQGSCFTLVLPVGREQEAGDAGGSP